MPTLTVQSDSQDVDRGAHSFDHGRDTSNSELETTEGSEPEARRNGDSSVHMVPNPRSGIASPNPVETSAIEMTPNRRSEPSMEVEEETGNEEASEEIERIIVASTGLLPDAPPEDGEEATTEESSGHASSETAVEESPESETAEEEEPTGAEAGDQETNEEEAEEKEPPRSPEEDPGFQAAVSRAEDQATAQRNHRRAETEATTAQAAAPSPENETESLAQAGQVEEMDRHEAGTFDAESFKELLMERIAAILPTNEEEADRFSDDNRMDEVRDTASRQAEEERQQAAGAIESTTAEEPDTASITRREHTPLEEPEEGPEPGRIGVENAMPDQRSSVEVSEPLQENMGEVDQQMQEAGVTDEQLAKSNEPEFAQALNKKTEVKEHTEQAPEQLRQQEQTILDNSRSQARASSTEQLEGMQGDRSDILAQVMGQQEQLMSENTSERQQVADDINQIYEDTKSDVEEKLSTLEEEVNRRFEEGADRAKRAFEDYVDREMDVYKEERYGEWFDVTGWGKRAADVVTGLPEEVNEIFMEGRELYIDRMDVILTGIADYVATQLHDATGRIEEGKEEVQEYVTSLPENLQEVGQEAAEDIQGRFNELEQTVNSKQDELVDSLAQQYKESLEAVDERIEEMKAENQGLLDAALGAITGVIETIIQIKNMLTNMLSGAVEAIKAIIADPIGFLGNLIQGVKQGFTNFLSRILEHLQSGLIGWLTGALGPVGIEIPDDLFSLKGIFSLVMQVLGLTWDYVREKAVQLFGEPVVKAMETGLELFQILRSEGVSGLWEYVKEKFTDLKETVIGSIKDMVISQVIQAGVKWVMGLLNPAGAFVKAAMLIIDIVKFFIERGSQIIELVNAISESIRAIASGNVGQVAAKVEGALKRALPVLIGFLASLLGISGLASKVQNLIKKIRTRIDEAITKVLMKGKKMAGDLLAKLGIGADKSGPDPRTEEEKRKDLGDATKEADRYLDEEDANPEEVRDKLSGLKTKYDLTEAELEQNPRNEKYYIEVKINPKSTTDEKEFGDENPIAELEERGYRSGATIYIRYKSESGTHIAQITYRENWREGMDFIDINYTSANLTGKVIRLVQVFLEKVRNGQITLHAPDGDTRKRRTYLRGKTPSRSIQSWAQSELSSNSADPAFPSETVDGTAQADHIVPVVRIFALESFWELNQEQQLDEILNWRQNFVALSPRANASKGPKSFKEWTEHVSLGLSVDENFRQQMIQREETMEQQIESRIKDLKN